MKKFFGFGPSTPPPPPPPAKPPSPPPSKPAPAARTETPAKAEAPKPQPAPAAPSILGRWKDPNTSDITEFHADGAVTENAGSAEPIRGRYSVADGKVKLNLEGVEGELSFPITIKADTLEMVDAEGTMTRYQRVK